MKKSLKINICGLVQGVGFRPFVYKIATENKLNGYVLNNTSGVEIEIEGDENNINRFLESIKRDFPSLSEITNVIVNEKTPNKYIDFKIKKSIVDENQRTLISPDISICDDCLGELFDSSNRRYKYPFITCTNCGPRFTIISDIPYDRINNTMNVFQMCDVCISEYENPSDRRFHSQTNSCFVCGPEISLVNSSGKIIEKEKAIELTIEFLKQGKIIAVKGLGGFHLLCDATNDEAVINLRKRKLREEKSFAILSDNVDVISEFAYISEEEIKLLSSRQKPIVLLEKKEENFISKYTAPHNDYFGVMLPYTPLHYLIIRNNFKALIDTSGNLRDEPIAIDNNKVLDKLSSVADYFLIHNREIYNRCDDSVFMVFDKDTYPIRRSRGYVPFPIRLNKNFPTVLGCGGELKNTFCFLKGEEAFLSQHIGDIENLQTYEFYCKSIEYFKKVLKLEPEILAYDLHPRYLSTQYAMEIKDIKKLSVQHHHAHIASCMAENGYYEKVIGLALDGTGYGTDDSVWGGEVLIADYSGFERIAHFDYTPMPGGEKAIKEPWRMGLSYLYKVFDEEVWNIPVRFIKEIDRKISRLLIKMISENVNCPMTSSLGRLFDGVSSIIGIRNIANYEGQAAIELENSINIYDGVDAYHFAIKNVDGKYLILLDEIFRGVVDSLIQDVSNGIISYRFHKTIVDIFLEVSEMIRRDSGINTIALSGGCFQNMFLLKNLKYSLIERGFNVIHHKKVPTNDGGISLGQAVIAGSLFENL